MRQRNENPFLVLTSRRQLLSLSASQQTLEKLQLRKLVPGRHFSLLQKTALLKLCGFQELEKLKQIEDFQ
jgi:hypothetical protein